MRQFWWDRQISRKSQIIHTDSKLNNSIANKEIELVLETLPTEKNPGLHGFICELNQIFKVEAIPVLHKLFHKLEEEGIPPNPFCESSITWLDKDITNKSNYKWWTPMNTDTKFLKIQKCQILATYEKDYISCLIELYLRNARLV